MVVADDGPTVVDSEDHSVLVADDHGALVVVEEPTVVLVSETGPGPRGEPGPPGPPGPGGADAAYTHIQAIAAATWVINHPLGKKPSVAVVDSAGTVQHGTVTYPSTSQVVVAFLAPFGGEAYLN